MPDSSHLAFLDNQRSVTQLTHPSDYSLQKSDNLETRRGHMAPKPATIVAIVLAMALTILTAMASATPNWSPIFGPQLLLLY
jgi:hypothetical protein